MGHAETERAFFKALLDPEMPVPAQVTTSRGKPAAKRFAVYRNNVAVALSRALASRFPVVLKLVGSEFFAGMIRVYVAERKPDSPIITTYGDDLADFIDTFEPAATVPYLAGVARLEAAWTRAYHAADAGLLEIAALATLDGVTLSHACLASHPAATLVHSAFPAGRIWQAHQGDEVGSMGASGGECVLVARPVFDVAVHILPAGDAVFATSLFAGKPIGTAAEAALTMNPGFDFGSALVGLVSLGAFSEITIADGVSSND